MSYSTVGECLTTVLPCQLLLWTKNLIAHKTFCQCGSVCRFLSTAVSACTRKHRQNEVNRKKVPNQPTSKRTVAIKVTFLQTILLCIANEVLGSERSNAGYIGIFIARSLCVAYIHCFGLTHWFLIVPLAVSIRPFRTERWQIFQYCSFVFVRFFSQSGNKESHAYKSFWFWIRATWT